MLKLIGSEGSCSACRGRWSVNAEPNVRLQRAGDGETRVPGTASSSSDPTWQRAQHECGACSAGVV